MGLKNHEIAYYNPKLSSRPPRLELLAFLRQIDHKGRKRTHQNVSQIPYVLLCRHALTTKKKQTHLFVTLPGLLLENSTNAEYVHDRESKRNDLDILKAAQRVFQTYTQSQIPTALARPVSLIDNVWIIGRDTHPFLAQTPLSKAHPVTPHETIFAGFNIGANFEKTPQPVTIEDARQICGTTQVACHKIVTQWVEMAGLLNRIVSAFEHGNNMFRIVPAKITEKTPKEPLLIHGAYVQALQRYAHKHVNHIVLNNPSDTASIDWIVNDPQTLLMIPRTVIKTNKARTREL